MMQTTFNSFNSHYAWGTTLPKWQHLLLSKLVAMEGFLDEDLDEIFANFLIDQHLTGPDAVRAAWDRVLLKFQGSTPKVVSTLTAMTSVSRVKQHGAVQCGGYKIS
jgi:hypothetical protein